ncbi:uncharacterized protein LOC111694578 [Trichogramma pretiosum]|uniref:uncharacterized protein LOC111694578 n=1 Tax=Trichogramma pretiosum TaxID=7493 RepID=UPI000C71C39A|nr:uncharacterized protein LOC111694578 [Trichogramma pretiosum]
MAFGKMYSGKYIRENVRLPNQAPIIIEEIPQISYEDLKSKSVCPVSIEEMKNTYDDSNNQFDESVQIHSAPLPETSVKTESTSVMCTNTNDESHETAQSVFNNAFTLPTKYLPQKKREKLLKSGKQKTQVAAVTEKWLEKELEKEKIKDEEINQKMKKKFYACRLTGLDQFHKYECAVMAFLIGVGLSSICQLALRLITKIGLNNCLKIYHHLTKGGFDDECQDILKLHNLETNKNQRTTDDLQERALVTIFMLECLKKTTFFTSSEIYFSSNPNFKKDCELIIGVLLLKNLQFLQFNAFEIYDYIRDNSKKSMVNSIPIGIGIYPHSSRFNHQCYSSTLSNAVYCKKKFFQL